MAFWDSFLESGIEGAAKGVGQLGKDLRAAITGKEVITDESRIRLEEIASALEGGQLAFKTTLITQINQTMRAEAASEHWPQWSWRPFWGFVSGIAFGGVVFFCLYLCKLAVVDGDSAKMTMIPAIISAFTGLFAIPGTILGVTAWHRGKEKRERIK